MITAVCNRSTAVTQRIRPDDAALPVADRYEPSTAAERWDMVGWSSSVLTLGSLLATGTGLAPIPAGIAGALAGGVGMVAAVLATRHATSSQASFWRCSNTAWA
ncbi:MAG: hypothetical protein ACYCW6_12890 [Candidatus Xenobia bacterium]